MDVHELSGVLGAGQASMPIRKILAELLTWIGIIGGCLTLFRAFADVTPLSHWAIALLAAWHFVTAEIPAFVLAKLGLAAPTGPALPPDPAWVGAKSFFLFTIPLGFGLRLKASQLALGWLQTYPDAKPSVQKELLNSVHRYGPLDELRVLAPQLDPECVRDRQYRGQWGS